MSTDLDKAIRKTQSTLTPIFSKPKLSSKLLAKPPFRFIHDIVISIQTATRFPPKNYFSEYELSADAFPHHDKSSKLEFLEKIIRIVDECSTHSILGFKEDKDTDNQISIQNTVRPSKILAGLEPIHTNLLLTRLAKIASKSNVSSHYSTILEICENIQNHGKSRNAMSENDNKDKVPSPKQTENKAYTPHEQDLKIQHDECDNVQNTTKSTNFESYESEIAKCNGDITTTQTILSNLVTKPKCSEKLLSKPPFRFLHDLFMAIDKVTEIRLDRILSVNEMDSANIKSKEEKIRFLEKIISHVESILDTSVYLKPNKVVAGLEADVTCHFLQLFSLATTVVKTKNEVSMSSTPRQNIDVERREDNIDNAESKSSDEDDREESKLDKEDNVQSGAMRDADIEGELVSSGGNNASSDHIESSPSNQGLHIDDNCNDGILHSQAESSNSYDFMDLTNKDSTIGQGNNNDEEEKIAEEPSNSTIVPKKQDNAVKFNLKDFLYQVADTDPENPSDPNIISDEELVTTNQPSRIFSQSNMNYITARPTTARKRPPKVKEPQYRFVSRNTKRQDSNVTPPTFIPEDNDVDENNILMSGGSNDAPGIIYSEHNQVEGETPKSRGMKLRLNTTNKKSNTVSSSSSNHQSTFHFSSTYTNSHSSKNLDLVSNSLQNIARSTAPMGRFLNRLPNDLKKLMNEHHFWVDERIKFEKELESSRQKTLQVLEPYECQLLKLEGEINSVKQMTDSVKLQILKNEEWMRARLERMTSSVN